MESEPRTLPPLRRAASAAIEERSKLKTVVKRALRQAREEEQRESEKQALDELKQIPLDTLASEWLNLQDFDLPTRVYLVENCLGSVVLSLERLLKEVDKHDAASKPLSESGINPINFLASYLMRNNPRFSNFAEASPYVQSMKAIELHLKDRLLASTGDRKALIHAEVHRRRKEVESELNRAHSASKQQLESLSRNIPFEGIQRSLAIELYDQINKLDILPSHIQIHRLTLKEYVSRTEIESILAPHLTLLEDDQIEALTTKSARFLADKLAAHHTESSSAAPSLAIQTSDSYDSLSTSFPSTISMFAR